MADTQTQHMAKKPPSPRPWIGYSIISVVTFLLGIGGFGSASSGSVTMFGVSMEAKYACFIYFVLGALFVWSSLEVKKRTGRKVL